MRIWMALMGLFFGLVALMAAGGSLAVGGLAVMAGDYTLAITAASVAFLGFTLGRHLVVNELSPGVALGMARRWFWQRWGTSPIRRRVVGWVEAIGLALANRTVAHMRATIMDLAGRVNDLHEITRDLRADLKSAFQRELGLWKQVRALKRAKESCIEQARRWQAQANLWRETCIEQEKELRFWRKDARKRASRRWRFVSDSQKWGNRPAGMSVDLWHGLVTMVERFQPYVKDSEIASLAEFLAKIEDQHRANRRWEGAMLGGIGAAAAPCLAMEYPSKVHWDDLRHEIKRFFPDTARELSAINFLYQAMDAAGDAAFVEGRKQGHEVGSAFMQSLHGVGPAWDRLNARQ